MAHYSFVESGDNYYLFIDGSLVATTSDTSRAADYTGTFDIGKPVSGTGTIT